MSGLDMFGSSLDRGLTLADPEPVPVAPGRPEKGRLRRNAGAVVGLAIVASLGLAALLAPFVAPHDPNTVDLARRFQPPSWTFPFGTDELGRDVASRMLFGGRLTIGTTVIACAAISAVGLLVGTVAGYTGGVVDTVLSRTIDALLAFPAIFLALVLTGLMGPGLPQVTLALVLIGWAEYARIVRSIVLSERERAYIEAARALGSSHSRIIFRHVLPAVAGPVLVLTTLEMGAILLAITSFSFIGLGVSPPTAEWGSMLAEAGRYLGRAPYMTIAPGAAIFLLVLGLNLVGDGLRDALDPRAVDSRN